MNNRLFSHFFVVIFYLLFVNYSKRFFENFNYTYLVFIKAINFSKTKNNQKRIKRNNNKTVFIKFNKSYLNYYKNYSILIYLRNNLQFFFIKATSLKSFDNLLFNKLKSLFLFIIIIETHVFFLVNLNFNLY